MRGLGQKNLVTKYSPKTLNVLSTTAVRAQNTFTV